LANFALVLAILAAAFLATTFALALVTLPLALAIFLAYF